MNLWHQRLIILLSKVIAVILGLIFVGYFVYYNLYFRQDALIKYVPKEAIAYATFRFTPDLGQNELLSKIKSQLFADNNMPEIGWDYLNQLVGNNLSFALVSNDQNEFDYLLLLNLGPRKNISEEYLKFIEQSGWNYYIFSNKAKSKKILTISSSPRLMEKVKSVAAKQEPSLAQKVNIVLNLKQYTPDNFWGRLYLDSSYFSNFALKFTDPQLKLAFTSLASFSTKPIFFGFLNKAANKIIVKNNFHRSDYDFGGNGSNLPFNIEYDLNFYNLAARWDQTISLLKEKDIQKYNKIFETICYYEDLYNLNINNEILPLLKQQVQLIKFSDNKYVLFLQLDNQNEAGQINIIENLIKTYLATTYPTEKEKQLPDYTHITQITRDLKQINFVPERVNNSEILTVNYKNQEFAYFLQGRKLILTNSRQILIDYINNGQAVDNKKYGEIDILNNFSQNIYINLNNNQFKQNIIQIFNGIYIEQGINNNEILLILE